MDALRDTRFLEASNRTLKKKVQRLKKRDKKKAFKRAQKEQTSLRQTEEGENLE